MAKNNKTTIKVFISSTFLDMEKERTMLMSEIIPELRVECTKRGVYLFAIDLRWGISKEEQEKGFSVDICLREIENCKPFFIGILGERYGWIPERLDTKTLERYAYLMHNWEGKSITELEIMHAVMENENSHDCLSFYFRSKELTQKLTSSNEKEDEEKKRKLKILKERILADFPDTKEYHSLKEFGNMVKINFMKWLDTNFPADTDAENIKQEQYLYEIDEVAFRNKPILRKISSYFDSAKNPALLVGDVGLGKTTQANLWYLQEPFEGDKIVINIAADKNLQDWLAIAKLLCKKIKNIDQTIDTPTLKAGAKDREIKKFSAEMENWLRKLSLKRKLAIIINDYNLVSSHNGGDLLTWLPTTLEGNVGILLTTNEQFTKKLAINRKWPIIEFYPSRDIDITKYVTTYLEKHSKHISTENLEKILNSKFRANIGSVKLLLDYLIRNSNFRSFEEHLDNICNANDREELYKTLLNIYKENMPVSVRDKLLQVLSLIGTLRVGMDEWQVMEILINNAEISAVEWSEFRNSIFLFKDENTEDLYFSDKGLKEILMESTDSLTLKKIHKMVGSYYLKAAKSSYDNNEIAVREAVYHLIRSQSWKELKEFISNNRILRILISSEKRAFKTAWLELILHTDNTPYQVYYNIFRKLSLQEKEEMEILLCEMNLYAQYKKLAGMPIEERDYKLNYYGTHSIGKYTDHVEHVVSLVNKHMTMQSMNSEDADKKFEKLQREALSTGDPVIVCDTFLQRAKLTYLTGDNIKAYEEAVYSMKKHRECGELYGYFLSANYCMKAYLKTSNFLISQIELYNSHCQALTKAIGRKRLSLKVDIDMATAYYSIGDFESCKLLVENALNETRDEDIIEAANHLLISMNELEKPDKALEEILIKQEEYLKSGETALYHQKLIEEYMIYRQSHNYQKIIEVYEEIFKNITNEESKKSFMEVVVTDILYFKDINKPEYANELKNKWNSYFNDDLDNHILKYIENPKEMEKAEKKLDRQLQILRSLGPSVSINENDPSHIGRYGYDLSNPILVNGVKECYNYLDRLRTESGDKIIYKDRKAIPQLINKKVIFVDKFRIFNERTGEEISDIYICISSNETSKRAPKGFMLLSR